MNYGSLAKASAFAIIFAIPCAVIAKDKPAENYVIVNEDVGLPVFPNDITDRPYQVVGEIKTSVRKSTIFSKAPSQDKIYAELWERAKKMGADAVVKAQYGDAHVTAMSWGASTATGVAVKFAAPSGATK